MNRSLFATLAWIFLAVSSVAAQDGEPGYYDLGGFHYEVSTDSKQAQLWFDRGLAMCFGFNHEEAARCFEQALVADPAMPMAFWGLAYAWGPNINNMEIEASQIAQAALAVRMAKLHSNQGTNLEKDLLEALARRFTTPVPEEREGLNRAYADAMRGVYSRHPHDPLVATLFAESLMCLQPWQHYSPSGTPGAETAEIKSVLEKGLEQWPNYPSLCHLYIHTMEMSPTPELALPAANRLRNAMPGMGHLVHMPTHIDVLLGDYESVITSNQRAIVADNEFARREGQHNFYTLYRVHNYHFLVYGAMFDGQSKLALRAARELVQQVPEDMLRAQTDFLDAFMPTALHVMVRFGMWEEILKEAEPADYLPVSRSMRHYARALAFASTGRVAAAKKEQEAFERVRATVPETSFLFQNSSRSILEVAATMMAGEIAYREGQVETAFRHLRTAVQLDDALNYDEPWGWMQPARHALGALLLEQGQVQEGEQVYRTDLERHPNNPWALHGLAECLDRQGDAKSAAQFRRQFQAATQRADVTIDRSCYCRLTKS